MSHSIKRNSMSWLARLGCISVVLALLPGIFVVRDVNAQATPPLVAVNIGWFKVPMNAHIILMSQQAKNYGLDIKLIEFQRFPEMRVALSTGAIDFATVGPIDIAFAAAAGNDIVAVAGASKGADLLVKRKGIGNLAWQDFASGKLKLGSFGAGIAWIKTIKTLEERGIDFGKVSTVNVAGTAFDMMQTLRQGSTDVVMNVDPFAAQGVVGGYAEYADELDINKSSIGSQNAVFATTGKWVSRPAALDQVLRNYLASLNTLNKDRNRWIEIYQSYSGLERNVASASLDRIKLDPAFDQQSLQNLTVFLFSKGILQKDLAATIGSYYQYGPLAKATGQSPQALGSIK